ncbi:MAG: LrgB family protein [Paramuribaculum sp.]|nr:LrgB family protein [Paramuribaculum sp.]
MEFLRNPYFLIALTFVIYLSACQLRRQFGLSLMNPILISVILLVAFLYSADIEYETYYESGKFIEFWLKPAVVALGVPLYGQLSSIRKQLIPLLMAELAGCIAGLVSVVAIAELFGATKEVIISLAPKAVTTPIAMEISSALGGNPSLTAAVVVCVGIFGGMAGFSMVRLSRIKSSMAGGLSIGTASHAVGTAAAIERGGERYGAFSSLGLTLNGLFTALLAPVILPLLGY